MHICSTWSEDVRVVLRLSSYCSDLKITSFTDKAMMLWDACLQLAFIMYNDLYLSDNNQEIPLLHQNFPWKYR